MKKSESRIIDYQLKTDHKYTDNKNSLKTTNINILLNRVRLEKKNKSKKKIILSLSVISALFFLSMIVFSN